MLELTFAKRWGGGRWLEQCVPGAELSQSKPPFSYLRGGYLTARSDKQTTLKTAHTGVFEIDFFLPASCLRASLEKGSRVGAIPAHSPAELIPHIVFLNSFCRSQLFNQSVNMSLTITNMMDELTDLCGNWILQNDIKNFLCDNIAPSPATLLLSLSSEHGTDKTVKARLCSCLSGKGP